MEKKLTKKDYFSFLKSIVDSIDVNDYCEDGKFTNENVDDFIIHELALLDKKATNKKPTKAQIENNAIKDTIMVVLAELDAPTSATSIAVDPRINVSSQKVTPLLTSLTKEGKVVRIEEKGKALYSIA